ncbi:MAG: hypothetical protein NTZ16_12485 [Verrucomicrobia bacterium]|nr:hypothetical protein [Verrucomicrobiota bacterium]
MTLPSPNFSAALRCVRHRSETAVNIPLNVKVESGNLKSEIPLLPANALIEGDDSIPSILANAPAIVAAAVARGQAAGPAVATSRKPKTGRSKYNPFIEQFLVERDGATFTMADLVTWLNGKGWTGFSGFDGYLRLLLGNFNVTEVDGSQAGGKAITYQEI